MRPILLTLAATLAATVALTGCGRGTGGNNSADNQLVGNEADAAIAGALGNQISVDQSAGNASKGAANSVDAAKATPGAIEKARTALNGADHKGCASDAARLESGNQWADKLPAAFGIYPGAKVTDAAGNNANGCSARIVSMTSGDEPQKVLDWYNTRAVKAGYTTEHRVDGADHILGGTNDKDGGAYYVVVTPGKGGTDIELIADKGR
jgi:hypothetical protein